MKFDKEDGVLVRRVPVAVGYCHDCRDRIGPKLADNVGSTLADEHLDHDVESYGWTETEVAECSECGDDATHVRETATRPEKLELIPYCDGCYPQ